MPCSECGSVSGCRPPCSSTVRRGPDQMVCVLQRLDRIIELLEGLQRNGKGHLIVEVLRVE